MASATAGFQPLLQALERHGTLPQCLDDPAVQHGLRCLLALLGTLVSSRDVVTCAQQQWSKRQLEFLLSTTEAIIVECCDLPAGDGIAEPVERLFQLAVQLGVQSFDNLSSRWKSDVKLKAADEELYGKLLLLIELAVIEGKAKERGPVSLSFSEESSPDLPSDEVLNATSQDVIHCHIKKCPREGSLGKQQTVKASEDILALLAGDPLLADDGVPYRVKSQPVKTGADMLSSAQHFAILHIGCHLRLLVACKGILLQCQEAKTCGKDEEKELQTRIFVTARILKLLDCLSNASMQCQVTGEVAKHVIRLGALLPPLFELTYSQQFELEGAENQESSLSALLSSFLQLAEAVLSDDCIFLNMRTFLAASALEALDVRKREQVGSSASSELRLVFKPQVISYLLGLIQDVHAHKRRRHHVLTHGKVDGLDIMSRYQLRSQVFSLGEVRSQEEHMQFVFPLEGHWLDKLVGAIDLFYVQGMEARRGIEKLPSIHKDDFCSAPLDHVTAGSSEDEALFGDLFSESGRHSVNSEGSAQPSLSEKKLSGHQNTPLQAVVDLLSFLKDCIFSLDWQRSTFTSGCKQLNKGHVDVLLHIYISHCSPEEKVEKHDVAELQATSDLLAHLYKMNLDLLHSLVVKQALPNLLEEHFFLQLLEKGYSGCTLPSSSLVLLAKVLINCSTMKCSQPVDSLKIEIWKSFVDTIVCKAQSSGLGDVPMWKHSASLPSLFHMEVLLMAFHSAGASGRLWIMQKLMSAVRILCDESSELKGSHLTLSSLLFSRVVMGLRYMVFHFRGFPTWLLAQLRNKLGYSFVGEDLLHHSWSADVEDSFLMSWTGVVGSSLFDGCGVGEQQVLEDHFLSQLFDITGSFSHAAPVDWVEMKEMQSDLLELCSSVCCFLEKWRCRAVRQVEELIIERYTFFLGWRTLCEIGPKVKHSMLWDLNYEDFHPLGADFFLRFSKSLCSVVEHDSEKALDSWVTIFLNTVSSLERSCVVQGSMDLDTIDLLRLGSILNLLLSLLQAGLTESLAHMSESDSQGGTPKFCEVLEVCKRLALIFMEDGQPLEQLLRTLSSMLSWYSGALHRCVLSFFSDQHFSEGTLSSIILLLQAGLSLSKREDLLGKLGVNFASLQSLLRWGASSSWQSETLLKLNGGGLDLGFLNRIFLPALLHGYPSCSHPGSAAVVSCLMVVEAILDTTGLLLRARGSTGSSCQLLEQGNILSDLLKIAMTIKLDSTFEIAHPKCEKLINVLVSSEEWSRCNDMYLLKQKDSLLASLCCNKEVTGPVREELIVQAVEAINSILVDPDRVEAFRNHILSGSGHLSIFIDVLDGCYQETVNVKVLRLLTDIMGIEASSNFRLKWELQEKFLSTNLATLSLWLEQRFLGYLTDSVEGTSIGWTASQAVRDVAAGFLYGLVSISRVSDGQDLRSHLLDALLLNLERAFNFFDISSVRAYFSFIVQLASGDALLRCVIRSVTELMGKLPLQGNRLEGQRCLLAFLSSVLNACGVQRLQVAGKLTEGKHWPSGAAARSTLGGRAKQSVVRKSPDLPHPPVDQSGHSADCDATSVDEDEDDGTSDGEITSLDKDDDDDGNNSEKALASRVCTFTSSGSNFLEQHWYFCYTCDLTVSKGCCSVCAKVCHRGHKVVYSRLSRFFCDCGAGSVRGASCICLKPRKYVSPRSTASSAGVCPSESLLPLTDDQDHVLPSDSDSDLEEDPWLESERQYKISVSEGEEKHLLAILLDLDVEGQVLSLCKRLVSSMNLNILTSFKEDEISIGEDKTLIFKSDLMQLKRAYKSGSFDMKVKADYSNARDLKSHLSSGSLVKSLLTISSKGRLAVGEGDKVTIFDIGQLIGQSGAVPVTVDKATVKPQSKNSVRFELLQLLFNSVNESYLAVAGYEDCQIFTVNPRGEVTDRLALELALQDAHIRCVAWVPGSQVQLMVVTNKFVKIYDLSQDNISPVHYFTVLEDSIADGTLVSMGQGQLMLLVLSQQGVLYTQQIVAGTDSGARVLTDTIQLPEKFQSVKGVSVHFSTMHRLLFLSYADGLCFIGRLNADATLLKSACTVLEVDQDGKTKVAGLHHWRDAFDSSGLFVCLSSQKSNSVVVVSMGSSELQAQQFRVAGSTGIPRVDGIAAYRPMSKDRNNLLILYDDGSLQVFSYAPCCGDSGNVSNAGECEKQSSSEAEQVKKLGAALLGSRANTGIPPVFPLEFFEKTTCITPDIRLGGDAVRNNDSEAAKLSLASEDGFLEGPNATGFKVVVSNSNPEMVMVGCRVHVGNTTTSHIPSELRVFQRSIKLEEGVRCWYDIPFTNAEALLADEEFALTVGPTFNGSSLPRIDNFEVYGRSKEDFGWKEKLDAVLDLETHATSAGASGSRAKYKTFQNASIQEQIVADSFRLLSCFYVANRMRPASDVDDARLELSRRKCYPLLELVFESDRQPLLQAAVQRVLHALYPLKDAYHQAKDTMRLAGIARTCPILTSKVAAGGFATSWAVQEFTSQMRAVCKIALHRRSSLASFLECHGSSVVDELMKLLWEILPLDQPDAQTINNLVIPAVDLIYGYAECLALHPNNGAPTGISVAPAVTLFRKLLFAPFDAVQASCSLAMSSRLLQVPFPKQTILAIDDIAEGSRTMPLPADGGAISGGSGQGMMEEDGGTASVQYCCDGCSTVPIVGRRWHCNVCPDFDLCEACYDVMDADRLPPPHSRDHPMSAIPIEVDSVGGEGSEMHFASIDELSDESLLQVATELSLQSTPASLGSTLDASEGGRDYVQDSATGAKSVTISASKKAVNSLLLSRLVEEIKGWMRSTSGIQAIPLMQLFYRLASAPYGPFAEVSATDGLDLERFIRLMLEELNLSVPLSVKARSNFGEIVILVFTFFNLMLRNWHQPGSDHAQLKSGESTFQSTPSSSGSGSPSSNDGHDKDIMSQLDRACSALRQQQLVNYLFSILQQLAHVFKTSSRSPDSGPICPTGVACGALLTVRREFAAGSFSPYFTDSYAKAHRGDLFVDFHRLLLESAFRLTYSLVRPEKPEKTGEKEQVSSKGWIASDLKLDGWQEVLCGYINNPHTTSIRRFARRLLLYLCGTKGHYYNVRDAWQLSREVKKLHKLVQKSGGFQGLVSYERTVKLVKCLTAIADVATSRPRNWQKYCARHTDILQFLLSGIFYFGEESVVQTLKLLTLAFYTGKESGTSSTKVDHMDPNAGTSGSSRTSTLTSEGRKKKRSTGEDFSDVVAEKAFLDMELAADQLAVEEGKTLRRFIDVFLLDWNATSVRSEAKAVLYGVWQHGRHAIKVLLLSSLLQKAPFLPSYGQNVVEYTDLLTWLLGKGNLESGASSQEATLVHSCLTGDIVNGFFDTLRLQNELLANHPNSRIYNTLSSLVEFDGYYLESEPCLACSCPEVPYTRMKLESLKSETKFTDNRILVKCVGSHTIQSVTMNVHDARRSKSVKVLNLYYNNRPVADLSELKNNWSLWKRAKSCHLTFNQTELKVEFPIPIIACNFMIELDSFYENLQVSSLESLQCPRCSRYVTDKHGICSNCHENAYQCRQCRNINYENLDSFLCNECGYSKHGRFEFNFMAKPSYNFDSMENDEDMKKGLSAIEAESENAHRRYQQLLGFKKPLLKLVSSIGETELDSQQKDSVQQMMAPLPGSSSFKINRKIAILGVLYGEKCKMAFDSVSRSVQTLQGLRRVLTSYLEQKRSSGSTQSTAKLPLPRPSNRCYGCANTFVGQCLEWLQVLAKIPHCRQQLVAAGILAELFENNIHQGPKSARVQAKTVLCALTEGDAAAVSELNNLIKQKALYCLEHHRSLDIAACVREELQLLSETCALVDEFWESRLRVVFQLLFSSIQVGARHPVIAEHIILPCLRIISLACTPPKSEVSGGEQVNATPGLQTDSRSEEGTKNTSAIQRTNSLSNSKAQPGLFEKDVEREPRVQDVPLVNYIEWKNGATYLDFVRRQYTVSQSKPIVQKLRRDPRRADYLALKYILRWKRRTCKVSVTNELAAFEESSWVRELVLSACSQAIRLEMCGLIGVLCSQSTARRSKFLDLLMALLPATRTAGESAAEYFELLYKMIEPEDARLYLTVRGFLRTLCGLITEEVTCIEAQEHSFHIDISQGYILHKFIELLGKFLQVPNIRCRFMKEELLPQVLEALLVIRGLVVQKTKLISDCGRLLRELLDSLLQENYENKRHFIRACIAGLQVHAKNKRDRTFVFILEQLCNIICPTKPEPAYMMVLNKAHTQEEFIRGSMTKNPYSSLEIGPLMRDVKNKICHQLDLLGLIEDDYAMELLVAGNIISLDLSVAQVYEQVWRKAQSQASSSVAGTGLLSVSGAPSGRECPPMTITYRLQGLDGEATEPMVKELEDDREESQDPEVEFAIAGAMRESGGLELVLSMVQTLSEDEIKPNQEELALVLKLLMYCCKIRENRQVLLRLGALGVLLETARRAFSSDAAESAEGLLLIVESLVTEANESDIGVAESSLSVSKSVDGAGEQAAHAVLMFLERLFHPSVKKSSKQQRNKDMVARILPYLTYGEQAAMEVLVEHFNPYLHDWGGYDQLQKRHQENNKDEGLAQQAAEHQLALENFVKVTESIKNNSHGERLKGLIMEKGITKEAVWYLKEIFVVFEKGGDYKSTAEWSHSLELSSVPTILSMLRGLCRGHLLTQKCLDQEGVLPLLHALEGVSGENEIGARAENLLDTLADKDVTGEGFLAEKVLNLRHATRDEMRRRALRKREELLQGLGMHREYTSDGGERIVVSKPSIEGLEEVEEEEAGLACMVCREGYSLRTVDMLGTYCYSKRVNLGHGTNNARAEWVYTTVSHFNVIHFQCHQEAKRADSSLKNPKKEWEGAALRNSATLCNNLFPLRGPLVPHAQYARCVDQYWDNLNVLGRADGSRLRLLTYDVVLMLARFATGTSFSTDCKGGGKESNSRLLPFMLQMACHLLHQGGQSQRRIQAKALAAYLASPSSPEPPSGSKPQSTPQRAGAVDETVQFMMVQSLLLESLDDWLLHRRTFLQRGIYHAYLQFKHGRTTLAAPPISSTASSLPPISSTASSVQAPMELSNNPVSEVRSGEDFKEDLKIGDITKEQLFTVVQPMLIYSGLVDQLQRYLKHGYVKARSSEVEKEDQEQISAESSKEESSSGHGGLEQWEVTMKERLRDVRSMLGFSKELLEWLDNMHDATDLQEAFDVMEALRDALSGGCTSCEDFVLDSINSGANR